MGETYNGWANYETWCIHMWLTNDEGIYDECREAAEEHSERYEPIGGYKLRGCYELMSWLKEHVEYLAELTVPDLFTSGNFVSDLYQAAISEVDWYEIADSFLAELKDDA